MNLFLNKVDIISSNLQFFEYPLEAGSGNTMNHIHTKPKKAWYKKMSFTRKADFSTHTHCMEWWNISLIRGLEDIKNINYLEAQLI